MYQKIQTIITLVLSVIAFYISFLAMLTLCFNSGDRINMKVNQSFQIDFNNHVINNNKKRTENQSITNTINNHSLNVINKLIQEGYNTSREITFYINNAQYQTSCRINLCKF